MTTKKYKRWKKLGRLFLAQSNHNQLLSHASNPIALNIQGDLYRIYYCGRDVKNRSSIGWIDYNITKNKTLNFSNKPVFKYGTKNCYYSHGISLGNHCEIDGSTYIYFMGWHKPRNGHWRGEIGRLLVDKEYNISIESDEPIFPIDENDPVSLSYPFVLKLANSIYCMWYGSTIEWDAGNGEMIHVIKYALSENGIDWRRRGIAINSNFKTHQAMSKPCVILNRDNILEMWFSYRGPKNKHYRIGYALSNLYTLDRWELCLDYDAITVSSSGWDSDMIEYPYVFEHQNKRYMLYNGNGYGITGFGISVLEN